MRKFYLLSLLLSVFAMASIGQSLPENWTVVTSAITASEETTTVNEGTKAMNVVFTSQSNQDIRSDSFTVTGGASFSYTLDVYDNDAAGRVRMAIIWSSGNDYQDNYSEDQANWQTLTYTGTVPATATTAYILLRFYDVSANWGGSAELIIDNAIFTEDGGSNLILNPSFEDWSEPVIPEYTIAQIQGAASASPYVGDQVITNGIVTGTFATGYFIQDGTGAWNGIYVYDNTNTPILGDDVTIKGVVAEFNEKTEITSISEYNVNSIDNSLPAPVDVTTLAAAAEMYEGVLVIVSDAECTVEDAGSGEWTVDDGSGPVNVDDLMFAYTPIVGNEYQIIGVVDFTSSAFKILPRSADDILNLGNPIENAILDAQNNSSLTIEPNPMSVTHGEEVNFDVLIEYATFSDDLPTGYYVDALINFSNPLPEGLMVNIVNTGYEIDVNYSPEAGATVLSLSEMLGTAPALLSGHSGLTDDWVITITGLGVGEYEVEISSLCDDMTDGLYSTFILASDVLNVTVTNSIEDVLFEAAAASSLAIDPESQWRTWGENADLEIVAVYPETIDPLLNEYLTDALISFEDVTPSGVAVSVVYDDNNGGHAELGTFDLPAGISQIYLSELIESARTPLIGHAGLTITWGITIQTLPLGIYIIHMNSVTNTEANFGTNDFVLADDFATITIESDELVIESQTSDQTICVGGEASSIVVTGADNITYAWFLGETELKLTTSSITVSEAGSYTCVATSGELTVTSDPILVNISVPVVNFGPDEQYCNGFELVLNPGEFDVYDWGGGSSDPTLTVTESGEYAVIVTDEYGCTASDTINILFILDWNFSLGEDLYLCPESTITLTAPVAGTYEWSTEETTTSIEITTPGEIVLTVTQGNCVESDTIQVMAAENPEAFDLGAEIFACQGSEVTLESPVVAEAYLWSTGEVSAEIVVTETGNYTLTIFNEAGCSISDDITVNFVDYLIVNLGDDVLACPGDTVTLDPADGVEWLWSDASEENTLLVVDAGAYSVTVTDAYGCSGSDEVEVSYRIAPEVNLGDDVVFCSGNTLELEAPIATEYAWSTEENLQIIEVTESGNYSVTITDEFGCQNADTMKLTVLPSPLVDLGPDNTITEDQTIILGAYPGYASYLWSNNSTEDHIVLSGLSLGVGEHLIWVRIAANNECETYDEMTLTVTEGIGVNPILAESVLVYPNPVANIINLNFGMITGTKTISLYDATGRCVLSLQTANETVAIDMSSYAPGLYTWSIAAENILVRKTVVKQ